MPTRLNYLLERVPLPSLRAYTFFSSSLFIGNILYVNNFLKNSINQTSLSNDSTSNNRSILIVDSVSYLETLFSTIISQTISLLILINTVYCSLALAAKSIQSWIFGELRLLELQRLKDKFWNYAFYKFCFLFGVLGLENLNELVLWISWFSVLAFALLFCQLAKERFELLAISASIRRQSLIKVLGLLSSLIILCLGLFVVCFTIGFRYGGLSIFFFMFAETLLLTLDTSYLLFKYSFQYIQQDQDSTRLNESRSSLFYYLEFFFVITTLSIDILHHLQMLFYHQTFMSMSSLIFFMQLKPLFHQLSQCLRKHKSYRIAMSRMEKKYPLLTKQDLEQKYLKQNHRSSLEEVCSICWEKFDKARCLPCGHLFHQNCLRSWLEQDTTCPICRLSLHEEANPTAAQPDQGAVVAAGGAGAPFLLWPSLNLARLATNFHNVDQTNVQRRARNHLFRFDGARYSSWLPSFSIEINHNFPFRLGRPRLTGAELATMSQHVQQIFPQIPTEVILADLQQTQSMDATINNIIDRRIRLDVQVPHPQTDTSGTDDSYSSSSASNSDVEDNLENEMTNQNLNEFENDRFDEDESFTWPLDPTLSFAERKQKLIAQMRRRFIEREQRICNEISS